MPIVATTLHIILATEGLPGYEHVLDGCELTVDVAAIAVAVALSCTACLEDACKRCLVGCCFFLCITFLLLYLGSFEKHLPHFLVVCRVTLFALDT